MTSQNKQNDSAIKEIRFYRASGKYGFLSNLFKCPIHYDDREFTCSEMAYQFGKPIRLEVSEWLVSAPAPHLCAAAAHALLSFDIAPDWNKIKVDRMRDILKEKFTQHKDLQKMLLDTGNAILIEESTIDAFWGIGKKGNGKNMLGVLLMEVRDDIRWGACEDLRSNESGDALCAMYGECNYPNCHMNPDYEVIP
jgi:ribA/ribD-fused uncharacterized protein